MFKLWNHQKRAAFYVRSKRSPFSLVLESPTGSGKSIIMAELLTDPYKQLVLTHRKILRDQLSSTLETAGIPHTFRASGYKFDEDEQIIIGMVQTEVKRIERKGIVPGVSRVLIDEIHGLQGPAYRRVFEAYRQAGADIIGFTATPGNLEGVVDECYRVTTPAQMVEQGFMPKPLQFACGQPDLEELEKLRKDKFGEYLAGDVDRLVQPTIMFGQVVKQYKRLSPDGRPFVLFAHSVKASIWWAQYLTKRGIPTAHIDGDDVWLDGSFYESSPDVRAECFKRVANWELNLSNRFVLREGFDEAAIGHVIVTCPVSRRQTWVQMCGRGSRRYDGREYFIIQDHGGNIFHPYLGGEDEWDWNGPPGLYERQRKGSMRGDEIPEPIVCPQCMHVRYYGSVCPNCGHRYDKRCRYVMQTDGELRLVEGRAFKPRKTTPATDGDVKAWKRLFWGARKHNNRTFEQVYTWYAKENRWHWLPRNLPFMPKNEADWFLPVKDVPFFRLHR